VPIARGYGGRLFQSLRIWPNQLKTRGRKVMLITILWIGHRQIWRRALLSPGHRPFTGYVWKGLHRFLCNGTRASRWVNVHSANCVYRGQGTRLFSTDDDVLLARLPPIWTSKLKPKLNSVVLVRKLTIPTERPQPAAKLVPTLGW
jgi:hypothetical protein